MKDEDKLVKGKKNYPNILFIVVDALRARNLGCFGYPKPTSPNIDNLARTGILFKNAFSCSNITGASLATISSGLYPISHGILQHGRRWLRLGKLTGRMGSGKFNETGIRVLPEILKSVGYSTLAVEWYGGWHRRGFDHYSNMLREANPIGFPLIGIDRRLNLMSRRYARLQKSTAVDEAHLITTYAKNLIAKSLKKRFFLFLHYWDVHAPYAPPIPFYQNVATNSVGHKVLNLIRTAKKGWISDDRICNEMVRRYDASIVYVDHEIGVLVDALEKYGILGQTLIILTSDHGESLTEHGIFFGHDGLYDVSIHVPLIFKHPTFPKNKRIAGFVQHFDLVPTILDFLEINKRKRVDGESVMPLLYGETNEIHSAVFAEGTLGERNRAIRTTNYKYIQALSPNARPNIRGGTEELYDLNKDPEETQNIVEEKAYLAKELKEKMSKWLSHCASR